MKSAHIQNLLFTAIILLALLARTYNLGQIPAGFFGDEAAIGYNAYSILKTGRDEFGVLFPFFFESFGDYKPGIAIYSSIPFILFFGLSEISVRLQAVTYGIISIFGIYLLTTELFSKKLALISIAISASMPWLIHYNRTGFELNSYVAFFIFSIYFLIKSVQNKSYITPAFILSALTFYTYYSAKLTIPLLLVGFFLVYKKELFTHKKHLAIGLILFFVISIPVIHSFFTGEGFARFNAVSVFSANLPPSDALKRIVGNYFFQLSPSFFLSGEPTPITRHFTQGLLPLLLATVPFFYIGIAKTFLTLKLKRSQLLLFLLILYPLGAAVVADAPFTGRTVIGAPLSAILISLGLVTFIDYCKKFISIKVPELVVISFIGMNFLSFIRFYFTDYPLSSSGYWGWQYGPREIISYFTKHESNYDEQYMIPEFNAPHIFFKFYAPNACSKCRLGTPHESYNPSLKQVFAVSPQYIVDHPEINLRVSQIIYYPNKTPAFVIGEIK